jgi:hypothetical protein
MLISFSNTTGIYLLFPSICTRIGKGFLSLLVCYFFSIHSRVERTWGCYSNSRLFFVVVFLILGDYWRGYDVCDTDSALWTTTALLRMSSIPPTKTPRLERTKLGIKKRWHYKQPDEDDYDIDKKRYPYDS